MGHRRSRLRQARLRRPRRPVRPHRGGHRRDPAADHRRPGPRPAPRTLARPRRPLLGAPRMNLVPTEEQRHLRDAARRFAASPPGRDAWRRLAEDLGVTGLIVPERHGGAGAGAAELTVVLEELGAALVPVPFLSCSVLAASLLARLGGTADLLAGIASGDAVVVAASWWDPAAGPVTADADGRLHGRLPQVVDGHLADVLLVVSDSREIFAVDADTVSRRTLTTLDLTRGAARVELRGVVGRRLPCADPAAALDAAWNLAAVGLAAEQL